MKRYKLSLTIVVLVVLLTFLFSAFLNNFKVENFLKILEAISSLVTLFIALFLFNKFGVEKNILEKNLDMVIELLQVLSKTNIIIKVGSSIQFVSLLRDLRDSKRFPELSSEYGNIIVIGDISVVSGLKEMSALGENPFMPNQIAKTIQDLPNYLTNLTDEINDNRSQYAVLSFPDGSTRVIDVKTGEHIHSKRLGLLNGKEMKLKEYIKLFEDIYAACQSWLRSNSSITPDLNL